MYQPKRNMYVVPTIVGVVVLMLWLLAGYPIVGQALIGLYMVVALWRGIASRQVLYIALVAFGAVFVAVVTGNYQAESAFAAYAFLLLVVSAVVLSKELWHDTTELRKSDHKEDRA